MNYDEVFLLLLWFGGLSGVLSIAAFVCERFFDGKD